MSQGANQGDDLYDDFGPPNLVMPGAGPDDEEIGLQDRTPSGEALNHLVVVTDKIMGNRIGRMQMSVINKAAMDGAEHRLKAAIRELSAARQNLKETRERVFLDPTTTIEVTRGG